MPLASGLIQREDVVRTVGPTVPPLLLDVLREADARTGVTGRPDAEALTALRGSGLLGTAVPGEYGGGGGDAAAVNRVVEQVATASPSVAIILFQHYAVSARIAEWGSDAQKSVLLPTLASGEHLAASAWSETGVGAAKKRLGATGERRADGGWLLEGTKAFATGAGLADLYLVLVQTSVPRDDPGSAYGSEGQTFFLVRGDNPGLTADLSLELVGMRGSATGFVRLSGCVVADEDRLGPLGQAPSIIAGVRQTGATLGAVSVGIAQAAYDIAFEHARRFDDARMQAVRHQIVKLGTMVEAARALVVRAGHRVSDDPGLTTLQSKLHASTTAERVGMDVARMLGSAGYLVDHRLNRLIADARAVALMGPTNELCRELVAASWKT
jgi:alkylation response protein AidB-like acyl-CoA dehydrogenase